jgi:hypothetical protein
VGDAYFSKAPFLNRMLAGSIQVISRMRKDAVGWDDPVPEPPLPLGKKKRGRKPTQPKRGKLWKLTPLPKHFPLPKVTLWSYGHLRTPQLVTRDLWTHDVVSQKVQVAVLVTQGDPLMLLSTDLSLWAEEIIQIYALRFPRKIGIRDTKQRFGLGQYQCTGFLCMSRFVGLGLISFCLWRLVAITDLKAGWLQGEEATSRLSFTRITRAVRVWVIKRIFQSSSQDGDFENSSVTPEELSRLVA